MEAYKFETTVLKNGIIKIPEIDKYRNQRVQIIIIPEEVKQEKSKGEHIEEFINSWVGRFSDIDTDDIRYNAIMDKHK